jgi:hypothetical protein
MGRRIRVQGKARNAVIAVVVLGLIWVIGGMIPGVKPALGFAGGHKLSVLRTGSIYTEARPGAFVWGWGSPRRKSSLLFASAGDEIVLESSAHIERGRIIISVDKGLWGTDDLYVSHVTSSEDKVIRVPVSEGGLYRVSANYVFVFRGRHDLDWYVG